MITSDLKHIEDQLAVTPCLQKALSFLRWTNVSELAEGKVEIEDRRIYALVQGYDTVATDTPKLEFHRKFRTDLLTRDDIASLTPIASEISGIQYIMDLKNGVSDQRSRPMLASVAEGMIM